MLSDDVVTVASLPMYDLDEVRAATDSWWWGLAHAFRREGLIEVPDSLCRPGNYRDCWSRPDLLLSQTCGYPLTHELRGYVTLVATPCYEARGCDGARYSSVIITHIDSLALSLEDLRGTRCAVNSVNSHSGYNALRHALAPFADGNSYFNSVAVSGSHLQSVKMVAGGEADVAAIDCVTFALLSRYAPDRVSAVRPLAYTATAPSLPYITSAQTNQDSLDRLKAGLIAACEDARLAECRDALFIKGFSFLAVEGYDCIDQMEREAIEHGYPRVR